MKTSIEIVTDVKSPHIHFCTTNVEVDDSPINNKNLAEVAKSHGVASTTDFFKNVVKKEFDRVSNYTITGVYPHGSIVEIDFLPKEVKDYEPPVNKKPSYEGDGYKQYVFDEGELKDVPSEILNAAKKVRDEFVKWFNEFTEGKVKVQEAIEEVTTIEVEEVGSLAFTVDYSPENQTVYIGTEDGTGETYMASDKEGLLVAIAQFLEENL